MKDTQNKFIEEIEDAKELEQYWLRLGWELGCKPTEVNPYHLLRYSSERQSQGSSIERQMTRQREACLLRGWTEGKSKDRIVQDLGVSAYHAKNFSEKAGLGGFLLKAQQKALLPNPVLMVENPDRFSRADIDTAESKLWTLVKSGCAVLFLSNGLLLRKGDERDIAKRLVLMFEFERAHQESKRKAMLNLGAIKAKIGKALSGVKVNMACWVPSWVRYSKEKAQYLLIPEKAQTVRKLVLLYTKLRSFNGVARQMECDHEPQLQKGFTGAGWNARSIKRILESPMLIGTAKLKGHTFKNFYPEVIGTQQWEHLQALLSIPRRPGSGTKSTWKILNLFPGMVTCAQCGRVARVRHRDTCNRIYAYFACRRRAMGCVNDGLRTIALELDFFGLYLLRSPKEALLANDESLKGKTAALKMEIGELDAEMRRLSQWVGKPGYEEMQEQVNKVGERRIKAHSELKSMLQASDVEGADNSWRTVMNDIIKMPKIEVGPNDSVGNVIKKLNEAGFDLQRQLEDQSIRRQLIPLMPSLIRGLVVDGVNDRYEVIGFDGARSGWRTLKPIIAALGATYLNERKERFGKVIRAYWKALTPEQRQLRLKPCRDGYARHMALRKKAKSSSKK